MMLRGILIFGIALSIYLLVYLTSSPFSWPFTRYDFVVGDNLIDDTRRQRIDAMKQACDDRRRKKRKADCNQNSTSKILHKRRR